MTESQPRRRYRAPRHMPIRGMLTAASAFAGATLVAVATVSGSYALWVDSAAIDAPSITTGSLTLLVDGQPEATLDSFANLLPGSQAQQTVTLFNKGTVASDISVNASAGTDLEVRVAKGECPSPFAPLPSDNANNADDVFIDVGTWDVNESATACVEVTMKADASASSQQATQSLTIHFNAEQRTNP